MNDALKSSLTRAATFCFRRAAFLAGTALVTNMFAFMGYVGYAGTDELNRDAVTFRTAGLQGAQAHPSFAKSLSEGSSADRALAEVSSRAVGVFLAPGVNAAAAVRTITLK